MTTPAQAVAERDDKPASLTLVEVATLAVEENLPRFQAVIPKGWDHDRFTNLVVAAMKREPKLLRCFNTGKGKASLLIAAIQCAGMGLEPNTPLREAALVPRRIKDVDEAQLMVEYRGLVKLARRSGEIATLGAEVVYERDRFDYELGLHPRLEHRPFEGDDDDDDPGPLTHCYAVVEWRGGGAQFVVVPRRVVHKQHRARSDSWRSEKSRRFSPWETDTAAMWRKTAVRVLEPFLPLSTEVRAAIQAAEGLSYELEGDQIVPVTTASQARDEVIDYDTGEIVEGDIGGGDSTIDVGKPEPSEVDDDAAWVTDAKGESDG